VEADQCKDNVSSKRREIMNTGVDKLKQYRLPWTMAWLAMIGISLLTSILAEAAPKFSQSKGMEAVEKNVSKIGGVCTPVKGMDFTWCVPVHVHNLTKNVTESFVDCSVSNANDSMLASASRQIPIPSG